MNIDEILVEDANGVEKLYKLYDKILYEEQNVFIYLKEEQYGEIELVFLKYDPMNLHLSENINNYDELVLFYSQLNL